MDRNNFSNIGDEIKDIVQNAVNTKDYHQLNRDIGNTVNSALDEVKRSIGLKPNNWQNRGNFGNQNQGNQSWNNQNYNNPNWNNQNRGNQNWNNTYKTNQNWNNPNNNFGTGNNQNTNNQNTNNQNWNKQFWDRQNWNRQNTSQPHQNSFNNVRDQVQRYKNTPSATKFTVPVGKISGILCTVFGSIGIGLFGIAIFVLGILGSALSMGVFNYIIMGLLPLLIGSVFLSARGGNLRNRIKRFNQYTGVFRNKSYCMIKELAKNSGRSDKFIIKDLRKMIAIGMFPEGHIDDQRTCFMLNNESYEQYLKLQENMKTQQVEEQKVQTEKKEEQKKSESESPEFRKAIEEGKSYIRQIREANDAIPGEEISQKLYRLENVTSKIFDYVEQHPEQLSEIQKFMDYYLPTTSKLLYAYKEFDMQPVQGENISNAKKEIESTLDTINLAFENLLDSLFQDAAMDVSTDISVLQTMLKQEGLTEKDFS